MNQEKGAIVERRSSEVTRILEPRTGNRCSRTTVAGERKLSFVVSCTNSEDFETEEPWGEVPEISDSVRGDVNPKISWKGSTWGVSGCKH
jgi:hypothetical protein